MARTPNTARDKVSNSTIVAELKLILTLANTLELMNRHALNRIRNIYKQEGYAIKDDMFKGLNDYCRFVKLASSQFNNQISPTIIGTTFDAKGVEENGLDPIQCYDYFQEESNELATLIMLFTDKTYKNIDNIVRTLNYLIKMKNANSPRIFNSEDIEYFSNKIRYVRPKETTKKAKNKDE